MTNQQVENELGGYESRDTESPASTAEVGGGGEGKASKAPSGCATAPASPLPAIEDVARAIAPWTFDGGGSDGAAQAIDSLYREHFTGWLGGDEAWLTVMNECGFTQIMSKRAARALAKAARGSGE